MLRAIGARLLGLIVGFGSLRVFGAAVDRLEGSFSTDAALLGVSGALVACVGLSAAIRIWRRDPDRVRHATLWAVLVFTDLVLKQALWGGLPGFSAVNLFVLAVVAFVLWGLVEHVHLTGDADLA